MKTKKEIKALIDDMISRHPHILDRPLETAEGNLAVTLQQLELVYYLDALYWVLEEKRPTFRCDAP